MLLPLNDYTFQIVASGTMLLGLASGVTGTFAVLRKLIFGAAQDD